MPSETQERQWLEERVNEKIDALERRVSKLEELLNSKPLITEDEKEKGD